MRSRLFLLPLLIGLVAVALVATGCGQVDSDGTAGAGGSQASAPSEPPDVATLVADSVAASEQTSAHYVLDATLMLETNGEASDPQLAALASSPIALHIEGDASDTALTAEGSVSFMGQTFSGNLLAGEHELFLNFLGSWYGTKELGLADAQGQSGLSGAPSEEELRTKVIENLDDLLTGEVSEGPLADGVDTWQLDGRLNADAIMELAQELGGEEITGEARGVLQAIADATTVSLLVGRGDMLPRRFELSFAMTADEMTELGASADDLEGLDSIQLDLSADLSDYGKAVAYDAPAQFQPLEQLIGQFLFGGIEG